MYAPGLRQLPDPSPAFRPFLIGLIAVTLTIIGWAAFVHSPVATDDSAIATAVPLAQFHSVAYSVPIGDYDVLYVRSMSPGASPRLVASFPIVVGLHAHGAASPDGNRIAVLSMTSASATAANPYASLSIVNLKDGTGATLDAHFGYLSPLAWSPDGRRVSAASAPGRDGHIDVIEASATGTASHVVATFHDVFEVAPVGYSADGTRLFIVTVDSAGSTLFQEQNGQLTKVATLSPGRTRDWSLSPDGARLAFIDIVGSGVPGYVGRTLVLATGSVTTYPAPADELSPAWQPGSEIPVFGGPGGQLRLTKPAPGAYPVPLAYSPDGTGLVATIYGGGTSSAALELPGSLELVSPTNRIQLSNAEGAAFYGWVRND